MDNEIKRKTFGKLTAEEISALKDKHGDVFLVKVDDAEGNTHHGYLRTPTRRDLSAASVAGSKDPLKFNEVIMRQCWVGGDESIRTDDYLFLAASGVISEMIVIGEARLEKL